MLVSIALMLSIIVVVIAIVPFIVTIVPVMPVIPIMTIIPLMPVIIQPRARCIPDHYLPAIITPVAAVLSTVIITSVVRSVGIDHDFISAVQVIGTVTYRQ